MNPVYIDYLKHLGLGLLAFVAGYLFGHWLFDLVSVGLVFGCIASRFAAVIRERANNINPASDFGQFLYKLHALVRLSVVRSGWSWKDIMATAVGGDAIALFVVYVLPVVRGV